MRERLDRVECTLTDFFCAAADEELAELLLSDAPVRISHALFVPGGSEALEAAMKLARQYFDENGEPERVVFNVRR